MLYHSELQALFDEIYLGKDYSMNQVMDGYARLKGHYNHFDIPETCRVTLELAPESQEFVLHIPKESPYLGSLTFRPIVDQTERGNPSLELVQDEKRCNTDGTNQRAPYQQLPTITTDDDNNDNNNNNNDDNTDDRTTFRSSTTTTTTTTTTSNSVINE